MLSSPTLGACQRMRRLQSRENALESATLSERGECLVIRDGFIPNPSDVVKKRVLRPNAGIIQARGYGMRLLDLSVRVLQQCGVRSVQHARGSVPDGGGMLHIVVAGSPGLDPQQCDVAVSEQRMEQAYGIRTAAHACHCDIGQAVLQLEQLSTSLFPNHTL